MKSTSRSAISGSTGAGEAGQFRHRVTERQRQVRLSPADVERLVALYAAGKPTTYLAQQLGIHRSTVLRILKRQSGSGTELLGKLRQQPEAIDLPEDRVVRDQRDVEP